MVGSVSRLRKDKEVRFLNSKANSPLRWLKVCARHKLVPPQFECDVLSASVIADDRKRTNGFSSPARLNKTMAEKYGPKGPLFHGCTESAPQKVKTRTGLNRS